MCYFCVTKVVMKRIVVVFLTFFYILSTSGVAWSSFYCCGKLKETYFFTHNDNGKSCKQDKKMPGCCDTKTYFAKVKDSHSPSAELKFSQNNFSQQLFTIASSNMGAFSSWDESSYSALIHAPPLLSKQPVYLSVCNFRI